VIYAHGAMVVPAPLKVPGPRPKCATVTIYRLNADATVDDVTPPLVFGFVTLCVNINVSARDHDSVVAGVGG